MKLVTVAEMRAIEREGNERGVSYAEMMERAGRGVAGIIINAYSLIETRTAIGLVGSGNNGGDTLIALETLANAGWSVCAYLLRPRAEDDLLITRVLQAGGEVVLFGADDGYVTLDQRLYSSSILLDGVLGTGVKLPVQQEMEKALIHIASFGDLPVVIAIDCPSGIDCDSGEVSPAAIPADLTICMEAVKIGLLTFPAFEFAGELEVVELGLPEDLDAAKNISTFVLTAAEAEQMLPKRPLHSHKGTFGTAMVTAGSVDFTGAALLAGEASYRIGAGLVRMAVPAPLHTALSGQLPEATWLLLPHVGGAIDATAVEILSANLEKTTALLIGPGIGTAESTAEFIRRLLHNQNENVERLENAAQRSLPPCILDADALKLVARISGWQKLLPERSILTPHPGEMSVLTGLSVVEIQADRLAIAKKFAELWGHVVVLKGALSVIAAPDGRAFIVPVATPALARAGTGDVLAGLITGLRAQGVPAFEAAAAASWIHAQAGLAAAEIIGQTASVLASDVLAAVPEVLSDLCIDE